MHSDNFVESKNNDYNNKLIDRDEIDLLRVFFLFKNEWKISSYIIGFFLFIGIIYAFLATPWFKAEVKIMPNFGEGNQLLSQYSSIANLAGINLGTNNLGGFYYYPDIIKSNYVLEKLILQKYRNSKSSTKISLFDFWGVKWDSSNAILKHEVIEKGKKKLKVEYIHPMLNQETDLLTIVVTVPKDPVLACDLANSILEQLDNYNKNFRHYKARDQREFIEKSLKETKLNLEIAENNLKRFLKENKDLKSPDTKLQYEKLSNELHLQRNLYNELKKQLEIAKIEEVKETETLNILEKATIPIERYKPKRGFILVLSLFIGLFIALIYVLIKNYYLYLKYKK